MNAIWKATRHSELPEWAGKRQMLRPIPAIQNEAD